MEQQLLETYCTQLGDATQMALQWVGDNADLVKNDVESLQKELRRAGRTFRKCGVALKRKMCAGVFGPSQAGKSYLLSAFARNSKGELHACFDDKQLDFITEINPEGGKESTGLVTRFTMTPLSKHPDGYSVGLRLLSETDLVKIIANTYYADCEHKEVPDDMAIQSALASLEARAASPCAHLTLDDMEDLHEYVIQEFAAKPRVQTLEKVFWNQAQDLAPKLATDDRIALYSLIWNEVPQFTGLLRRLVKALEQLRHPAEAFCQLDALTPRETSIIDVAMLQGLEGESSGDLTVATAGGHTATLPRAIVTALTAELTIVMQEKTADFFDHTDLLDFPGYRSRYKFTEIAHELVKEGMTTQMFLRGKVAYLFQRYCAERELTSMLLCIGPSNQEVQDLPAVINDWITSTHGKTEEERANLKNDALFFILTKCDVEFEEKKGSVDTKSRWDNRLHASLLDFFGKQHDWPTRWKPNQAFNNLFLLRNPNFRFESIMDIDGQGVEKGVRAEKCEFVANMQQSFLASEIVRRHFASPQEAWEEFMKLNDGGINYLRAKLSPLCNPDLKREQLEKSILATRNILLGRLKKYHFSDDKEEEIRKKKEFIRRFFYLYKNRELLRQRFGDMLNSFTLNTEQVYALHPEAERRYNQYIHSEQEKEQPEGDPLENMDLGADLSLDDILNDDFGSSAPKAAEQAATVPAINHKDEHTFFAMQIMSTWVGHMHSLAQSPILQRYYGLPAAEFTTLVNEIDTGAQRLRLPEQLEEAFRVIAQPADVSKDSKVRKQAGLAAATINNFVSWLGKSPALCPVANRTISVEGRTMPVFPDMPPVGDEPVLEEAFRSYTETWYGDWLRVFIDLLMHNVDFDGETTLNREQNALLGNILSRMENAA